MLYPFPGMNPYFENPAFWSEVHHLLIGILAETLNPQLLPRYRAAIEKRVYQMRGEDILFIGIPAATVECFRPATDSPLSSIAISASNGSGAIACVGHDADRQLGFKSKSA